MGLVMSFRKVCNSYVGQLPHDSGSPLNSELLWITGLFGAPIRVDTHFACGYTFRNLS